jgi:hypothetical protein
MNNEISDETPVTLIMVLVALALWTFEHIYYGLWTLPGVWIGWAVVAFFGYQLFRRKAWAWWVLTLLFSLMCVVSFLEYFRISREKYDSAVILFLGLHLILVYLLGFSSVRSWALRK